MLDIYIDDRSLLGVGLKSVSESVVAEFDVSPTVCLL